MTSKARAEQVAKAMWSSDQASQWFGMAITHMDEGEATLTLTVAPHHCNGLGICHGGVTYALADSAFAFACNSRNQATVAQHNTISYLAPAALGDVLTAEAKEISLSGRSGLYDVVITNQNAKTIAQFRGASRTVKGTLFVEE